MSGGVMDRILGHFSFKEFVLAGTDISPTKNRTFLVIWSTKELSTDRFGASGHQNRAPATALSAGIGQVKRAWPAWLPGFDFGTKCKKIRRTSQTSYCHWSTNGRTLAVVYIRHARREDRTFCP
jgi:hypothetical protein